MSVKEGLYLGEATREKEFKYGMYNSIIAPVGSGKTTYTSKILPNEISYTGLYIYLAPYTMLKEQVVAEELFNDLTPDQYKNMKGFTFFDKEVDLQVWNKCSGRIAMTPHSFLKMVYKNPEIMKRIGVIVIDEDDHVFKRLPKWETEEEQLFTRAKSFLENYLFDVLIIGITATGKDDLEEIWGCLYNQITFKEKLRRYSHIKMQGYSDIKLAFNESRSYKGRTAIFIESIRNMKAQRDYLVSLGYEVDIIVSDYAKNYKMTKKEKAIKKDLAEKGVSDKIGDILIFNAAMERGVSIYDKSFSNIIMHSSNKDIQTQVIGRFRFDGMRVWRLLPVEERTRDNQVAYVVDKETGRVTNDIVIPDKYLNIYLTTDLKKKLREEIGYSRGWTTLVRELERRNYKVEDKRVTSNRKRLRISVINKE